MDQISYSVNNRAIVSNSNFSHGILFFIGPQLKLSLQLATIFEFFSAFQEVRESSPDKEVNVLLKKKYIFINYVSYSWSIQRKIMGQ